MSNRNRVFKPKKCIGAQGIGNLNITCRKEFTPTGPNQLRCPNCGSKVDTERVRATAERKYIHTRKGGENLPATTKAKLVACKKWKWYRTHPSHEQNFCDNLTKWIYANIVPISKNKPIAIYSGSPSPYAIVKEGLKGWKNKPIDDNLWVANTLSLLSEEMYLLIGNRCKDKSKEARAFAKDRATEKAEIFKAELPQRTSNVKALPLNSYEFYSEVNAIISIPRHKDKLFYLIHMGSGVWESKDEGLYPFPTRFKEASEALIERHDNLLILAMSRKGKNPGQGFFTLQKLFGKKWEPFIKGGDE